MQYECESLLRRLLFMEMENHHMLEWLSQLLKENADPDFLVNAEQFQDSCVKAGEEMKNMRNQVAGLEAQLLRGSYEDGKQVFTAFRKLKAAMAAQEKSFNRLNKLFNQYLSGL